MGKKKCCKIIVILAVIAVIIAIAIAVLAFLCVIPNPLCVSTKPIENIQEKEVVVADDESIKITEDYYIITKQDGSGDSAQYTIKFYNKDHEESKISPANSA